MDGQEVWGRPIKVDFAKEDPTKMFTRTEESSHREAAPEATPEAAADEDETVVDENEF